MGLDKRSGSRGFTLIELVMIIVVIGILAAVAVPRYVSLQTDAEYAECLKKQAVIHSAIAIRYAATRGLPDSLTTSLFALSVVPTCPGSGTVTYTVSGDTAYTLTCTEHGGTGD